MSNWSRKLGIGMLSMLMAFSGMNTAYAEDIEAAETEELTEESTQSAAEDLQAQIDALPSTLLFSTDISADYHALLEIKAAYDALSEEEKAAVDFTKAEELLNYNSTTLDPENLEKGNSLEGKTIGYLGSSITQGFRSDGIAFAEYIAQLSGSTSVKQAIPGGTLALKEGYREEVCYINQLLDGALTDVEHLDALVVQLSTNDVGAGIPIGELSESYASEDMDYKTIIGAMEFITAYAKEKWDCPVMYYINAYLSDEVIDAYANGDEETAKLLHEQYQEMYEQMIDALYTVAEKWDLGVVDLWNDEYVRSADLALRSFFMDDPIHPHKAGYWFWYTQPIMAMLEDLTAEQEVEHVFTYDAAAAGKTSEYSSVSSPAFIIYPGVLEGKTADELIEELGVKAIADKYAGKATVVTPANGTAYSEADEAEFADLLGFAVSNAKVIGIDEGATFVNNSISQKCWAVSGIMTYGGEMKEGLTYDVPVPVYLSNASETAKAYYTRVNEGEELAYTLTGEEETAAEAFEKAWDEVFRKVYRQHNEVTEFYNIPASAITTPYPLIPSVLEMEETYGVDYYPHLYEPLNGEGEYCWFEYVPQSIKGASEGSVPLIVTLHGNGNDARIQGETTGWVELAAEEGFIVAAPEWQSYALVEGTSDTKPNFFNCDGLEREKLIEWIEMLEEKYPQIDTSRIYVTGLSAGASASTLYGALYSDVFAGVAAVSGPGVDKDELTEFVKDYEGNEMPWMYLCGDHDFFGMIPVDGSSPYSFEVAPGVHIQDVDPASNMFPFIQAYQKINGLEVSEAYDMSLNEYYGIAFDEQNWIKLGFKDALEGSLSNENGEIIRMVAIKDQAHWNYKPEAAYIWDFFKGFARDTESGELIREDDEIIVTDVEGMSAYAYDKTAEATEFDEQVSFSVPVYLIYPDKKVGAAGASDLLKELGIVEHIDKLHAKAYVINPIGKKYADEDADQFLKALDSIAAFSLNIKVIGIGNGATFVNQKVSQLDWAVSGIMTYGGEAGEAPKYSVPAYVSGSDAAAYAEANSATEKTAAGTLNIYTNPDNKFEIAVENTAEETLAEAFANAWKYVFVKNGKVGNVTGTWYSMQNSAERPFEYFTYFDSEALGIERTVVNDEDLDDDGVKNLWYEYVPASARNARASTVPMVLLLHGNTNDPRTQINTSGWAPLAAKEGIILVEAEWQGGMVNGTKYDAMTENDSTAYENDILAMLDKVFAKYPQINREMVYVEGLSRGSLNTMTLCLTHPEIFAAGGSHSGAVIGDLMNTGDVQKIVEELKDQYDVPWFFIAGEKDGFVPVSQKGGEKSGVYQALNLFEEMNEMDITEYSSLDESKVEWFGFTKMENFGEVANPGVCTVKGGTIDTADGNSMMSFNAIENWGHWNYEPAAQMMWDFFKQHTLSEGKTIVEETDFGYVYDRTPYNTVDGRLSYITPTYLIYPNARVDRYGAEQLLKDLGIIEHINKYDTKAYVINPYDRNWDDRADTENFLNILNQLGFAGNIKVIGIENGASFVDKSISKKAWAVSGIMTYNSKANMKGNSMQVPAYLSGSYNAANQYYISGNKAEKTGEENGIELYQNPNNEYDNVAVSSYDATMAEAFANAWKYVFSKNYRMYNEEEECYTAGLTKYTDPDAYLILPYPMYDELGLTYNSRTGLITSNATEEKPNQWYEVFPEEIDEAEEASIPMLVVLHGNGNDNRTQLETSGWATKAGEERIAIIAAEWQASRTAAIFNQYTALGEQGTVDLVKKVLEEHPAIDPGRVYVQGLSAGANAAYTYAMNHNDVFTASQGSSSPFMTGSAAITAKANEIREAGTYLPVYMLAGTADVYKPIPTTRGNGLVTAYAAANDIDVPAEMDFKANRYYGIALDNQDYYNINGQNVLAGTLSNDLGVMMKVVAMEPFAHWNNPLMVDDIWEFFRQYRRNPETGKIEMAEDDRFVDVRDESKYYYDAVYWARDNGITKGYAEDNTFRPEEGCTRAQMVTFLWRMAGQPEPSADAKKFSDVKSNAYYYKAVLWAAEKEITKGYQDGTFKPDETCLREHAMTFLYRYAGKPAVKTTKNPFNDIKASDYYYNACVWASENKIANGYSTGEHAGGFGPKLECLREHIVTFLYRYSK